MSKIKCQMKSKIPMIKNILALGHLSLIDIDSLSVRHFVRTLTFGFLKGLSIWQNLIC
jgi:hypothetical protein